MYNQILFSRYFPSVTFEVRVKVAGRNPEEVVQPVALETSLPQKLFENKINNETFSAN